ncbi:MAG: TonB-dependent receptor [Acidobacteriota bacterium]
MLKKDSFSWMRPASSAAALGTLILCVTGAWGQPLALEEEVTVIAGAAPVAFAEQGRSVTVLTAEEIRRLPVNSVAELLTYVVGFEAQSRGPFGVQADFSIRGSNFQQLLILVDGIRVNDPQTGHHNADLPVALEEIERIEVLSGTGSNLHGADAVAGAVNIVTRARAAGPAAAEPPRIRLTGGEHGLVGAEVGDRRRLGGTDLSLHGWFQRAGDFLPEREFRQWGVSLGGNLGDQGYLRFALVDKDFGARGFYGPAPSWEHTRTMLLTLHRDEGRDSSFPGQHRLGLRVHWDDFTWDRERPALFQAHHRTHSFSYDAGKSWRWGEGTTLSAGVSLGGDWIRSSSLGDHGLGRGGAYVEFRRQPSTAVALGAGLRFDDYAGRKGAWSPSLTAAWWVHPRLKWRASFGRAFRVPSFTELYYRDPNHEASPNLQPERAWEAETGIDWLAAERLTLHAGVFFRRERDVIDWIRDDPSEKWRTANLRRLRTRGAEFLVRLVPRSGWVLQSGYSALDRDADEFTGLSKYVLNHARHNWSTSLVQRLGGLWSAAHRITWKRRNDGQSYWVLNHRLARRLGPSEVFLQVDNLLDQRYEEIPGVLMPGRWFQIGVSAPLDW